MLSCLPAPLGRGERLIAQDFLPIHGPARVRAENIKNKKKKTFKICISPAFGKLLQDNGRFWPSLDHIALTSKIENKK